MSKSRTRADQGKKGTETDHPLYHELHQCKVCGVISKCKDIVHDDSQQADKEGEHICKESKFVINKCKTCEKNWYLKKELEWLFEAIETPLKWRLKYWWLWW